MNRETMINTKIRGLWIMREKIIFVGQKVYSSFWRRSG